MALVTTAEATNYLGGGLSAADTTLLGLVKAAAEKALKKHCGFWIEQATWTEYHPIGMPGGSQDNGAVGDWEVIGEQVVQGGDRGRGRVLMVKQLPIRSITTIHENAAAWDTAGGSFPASTLLTEGSSWQVDWSERPQTGAADLSWSGIIYRRGGSWNLSPRSIKVVYVAGLTTAELESDYPEFRLAAFETIAHWFNRAKVQQGNAIGGGIGPVTSESLADWSASYSSEFVEVLAKQDLPDTAKRLVESYIHYGQFLGSF